MRFFLSLISGFLLTVLLAEGGLRLLPVNSGLRMADSSAEAPYARYQPDQTYTFSYGWGLDNVHHGRVNRQGFTNSPDFADGANALVIGDSFIESMMLGYADTVQGQLAPLFGRVYAAGTSGNGMADALVLARHLLPQLHPKVVIMFTEPFDLSALVGPAGRGHNYFTVRDAQVELQLTPYRESPLKLLMLKSALVRYAYYNLKLPDWASARWQKTLSPTALAEQAGPRPRELALEYYLGQLAALEKAYGTRFIFLVDGDRRDLYHPGREAPTWQGRDRELFLQKAAATGFGIVDMQPVFAAHWAGARERLDFLPMDGHWNPVAHRLAAQQLAPLLRAALTAETPLPRAVPAR